ncbi:MAG: hypothetical protein HY898_33425 [Deltaproteobacteria bacterium]|nr:hypothetical protein [Deltaproteobacteria bacterium]
MQRPALAATVTHRVRAFLAAQGVHVEPWSSLDETYGRLYALLAERRADSAFWPALRDLIASVIQAASEQDRLPTRDAELLRSWNLEALIAELRSSLPDKPDPGTWRAFTRPLAAPVLGAFLLIGWVAVGCGGNVETGTQSVPSDASADSQATDASKDGAAEAGKDAQPVDAGWANGCVLDKESVLFDTLASSQLGDAQKSSLCYCFSGLNASWDQGLTELFAAGTPQQIAQELQLMMECCQYDTSQLNSDYAKVKDAFLNGTLCSMPKPYRGVTLPKR